MATELWVELVCAVCSQGGPGAFVFGQGVPRRALKEQAVRLGWNFSGDLSFCGQGCRDAHEGERDDGRD